VKFIKLPKNRFFPSLTVTEEPYKKLKSFLRFSRERDS